MKLPGPVSGSLSLPDDLEEAGHGKSCCLEVFPCPEKAEALDFMSTGKALSDQDREYRGCHRPDDESKAT